MTATKIHESARIHRSSADTLHQPVADEERRELDVGGVVAQRERAPGGEVDETSRSDAQPKRSAASRNGARGDGPPGAGQRRGRGRCRPAARRRAGPAPTGARDVREPVAEDRQTRRARPRTRPRSSVRASQGLATASANAAAHGEGERRRARGDGTDRHGRDSRPRPPGRACGSQMRRQRAAGGARARASIELNRCPRGRAAGTRRADGPRGGGVAATCSEERGVRPQVAAAEPRRLDAEPVRPLEPGALHPARCPLLRLGVEVERRADADHDARARARRRAASSTVSCLGAPSASQTMSGSPARGPARSRRPSTRPGRRTEGRSCRRSRRPRSCALMRSLEALERRVRRAERRRGAAHARGRGRARASIRSGPPTRSAATTPEPALQPGDRRAVGEHEPGVVDRPVQRRARSCARHQDVDVAEDGVAAEPRQHAVDHALHGVVERPREAAHAEHVGRRGERVAGTSSTAALIRPAGVAAARASSGTSASCRSRATSRSRSGSRTRPSR